MSPYIADEADIVKMAKALQRCEDLTNKTAVFVWLRCADFDGEQIKRLGEKAAAYAEQERKLKLTRAFS